MLHALVLSTARAVEVEGQIPCGTQAPASMMLLVDLNLGSCMS